LSIQIASIRRLRTSTCDMTMPCLLALMVLFTMCEAEVWAGSWDLAQDIHEGHFTFRLPKAFAPLLETELPGSLVSDTPWAKIYKERVEDLDRLFVGKDGDTLLVLGVKVETYRRRLRRALSYEEFASKENIQIYKRAVERQLEGAGLLKVSLHSPVVLKEQGVTLFDCSFESPEGLKGTEYYASALGSHEVVYLTLFLLPPARSSTHASFFRRVVGSFEFETRYAYNDRPQNWWQRRTWGERIEDGLKLMALFFVLYLGCSHGLYAFGEKWATVRLRGIKVLSVLISVIICLAVWKWVLV
jgi:hypothetical protein